MGKIHSMKRICAVCAAFVMSITVFSAYSTGSASKEKYSSQLAEIEKQQAEIDDKIAAADKQLAEEEDNLAAANDKYKAVKEKIAKSEEEALELEKQIADTDEQMRATQYSLDEKNEEIKKSTAAFMERIRAMYIAGGVDTYTNMLVDSADFYDVLMRMELVKRVASHDNDELENLMAQKREAESIQEQLETQRDDLQETMKTYAAQQKELGEQRKELSALVEKAGGAVNNLEAEKQTLQSQAADLDAKHSEISSKAATTTTTVTTSKKTTTTKKTSNNGATTQKTTVKTTTAPADNGDKDDNNSYTTTQKKTQAPSTTTTPPATSGDSQSKIDTVVNYAKSMVGGSYVWGGSSFGATDCSGLVMLSYAQIGINLPHLAQSQASYGWEVSYNDMKPGDLVFFGSTWNIYHVGMYIGNGMFVQAENSNTGIVISNLSSFSLYNPLCAIRRLI